MQNQEGKRKKKKKVAEVKLEGYWSHVPSKKLQVLNLKIIGTFIQTGGE